MPAIVELQGEQRVSNRELVPVHRTHVAIVDRSTARNLLAGRKRIESRFSQRRRPPLGQAYPGDTVHFKISGGEMIGTAQITRVREFEELSPGDMRRLRREFKRRDSGAGALLERTPALSLRRAHLDHASGAAAGGLACAQAVRQRLGSADRGALGSGRCGDRVGVGDLAVRAVAGEIGADVLHSDLNGRDGDAQVPGVIHGVSVHIAAGGVEA